MLPSLADKCSEFLREKLGCIKRVPCVARRTEIRREKSGESLLGSDRSADRRSCEIAVIVEKSMLEELVERDLLNVREVELFKAVDCWAPKHAKECEKQGLAAEGSVKRKILGERIVKAIRFPVMDQEEFADVVLDCDILTKKELIDLMKYFSGVLKFPKGFSEATRPGSLQRIKMSRFRSITKGEVGWHYDIGGRNSIVVSVNKPIKLYAVRLFGSKNSEYSVTLTVTDSNGVALETKTGKFMSQRVQSERGDFPLSRV